MTADPDGGALGASVTERGALHRELAEAEDRRRRSAAWLIFAGVGPMAAVAVVLALVFGEVAGAGALFGLGVVVELTRQWRLRRAVRRIEQALEDPMDGS